MMTSRLFHAAFVLPSTIGFLTLVLPGRVQGDPFLVKDGQAKAEIIIAEEPPRSVHLAARELRTYLEKITGARLAIGTEPSEQLISIYVGQSPATQRLGIHADDLEDGAYRIVSGEDWLVLIGQDANFTPIEPWPRSNGDIASGKMQSAWDAITGANWGYPHSQLHKHYSGPNSLFGTPNERFRDDEGNVHVWTFDERGSFNAVCGFLRDVGVRWYMPGEVGEVLPKTKSIPLPVIDKTVHPDFPMRILNFRPGVYGHDAMMWGFRLGIRQPYGRQAAHGMHNMTDNEPTLKAHPEWFALYGDQRQNDPAVRNNQLCYSNEELFAETVRFARAQLDHFDMDVVSIMPPDGYTAICQCQLCRGRDTPERGSRGLLSDYVWDFVNRVAREVGKTHPDKKISCCAYGAYTEPPTNIDKLEPNVQVIIVGGRRPLSEDRENLRRLRAEWQQKTRNPLEIFENYPFTGRGFYLPAFIPRQLGKSINETKGVSRGEDIWLTMDFGENAIGFNHFLIYFTARMYWGGKDQSAAAMFDEYVEKFYGPAAPQMHMFFRYCEDHWRLLEHDAVQAEQALDLFAAAKSHVAEDSIFARRLSFIDNYLNGLRRKASQLAQKRGPVPQLRLVSTRSKIPPIVIDGKLDDVAWQNVPTASIGGLRELQTGRLPTYGTRFMTRWIGNDLYFAIRCEDRVGEKLNVATDRDGDQAIWYGDCVELEVATDIHSYYQLAINPSGAHVDLDRGASKEQWFNWSSNAEVAVETVDGHWTVEVRLPITQDENDPLHQIVGNLPTQSLSWFINICRQRIRDNGAEYSAFSPTGSASFHVPMKFAHFYSGRSHQFPADESVTDRLLALRAADELSQSRKWKEAREAYLTLAESEGISQFQQSDALHQASRCAASMHEFKDADDLANRIPIEAVAKTARMENLTAQRKWTEIIDRFGEEDFSQWPFWQIGKGAFARGRAYEITKNGERAEADLQLALEYEPDSRIQIDIRSMLGHNRESHLDDDAGALEMYRQNFAGKSQIGGAGEFRSVDRAARILSKQGKYAEALAVYEVVDFERQAGYWLHEMLLSRADTLMSAGSQAEARALYRRVVDDPTASRTHRERATAALDH